MLQKAKSASSVPKYSKESFEEQMLTTFIIANLPFQLVENLSFRKLLEIARPTLMSQTAVGYAIFLTYDIIQLPEHFWMTSENVQKSPLL
jgi:hypothetical protein